MPSAERMKHPLASRVSNPFALKKLPHRRIVDHPYDIVHDLDLEMQISDHPTQPRSIASITHSTFRGPHFQHRLILLGEHIDSCVRLKNSRAIGQRFFQVEAEFLSVLRHAAPAALGEYEALHGNAQNGQRLGSFAQRVVN